MTVRNAHEIILTRHSLSLRERVRVRGLNAKVIRFAFLTVLSGATVGYSASRFFNIFLAKDLVINNFPLWKRGIEGDL
jgi:hypothetical protein